MYILHNSCYADVAQLAEQLICNQQVIGSSPIIGFHQLSWKDGYGPLAQLVEQLTLNQWVLGSSPRRRTMCIKRVRFYIMYAARWSSG